MDTQTRLTLNVKPHPFLAEQAARDGQDLKIVGQLKIAGEFTVDRNLEHGDELVVTVTGADGEAIAQGICVVAGPPPLIPLESKELGLIGYVRSHKAKVAREA